MKYRLLIALQNGPLPSYSREGEAPAIGSIITEMLNDQEMKLEVFGHQRLPVVPTGKFAHDELWVMCKPI